MAMHEFSLYSQIPAGRYEQVLHIFAGYTGTQPVNLYEQHLYHNQLKTVPVAASKKAPTRSQPQANRTPQVQRLIRDVNQHEDGTLEPQLWRVRMDQMPESGTTVISRPLYESEATPQDIERLHDPELYEYRAERFLIGRRFVHGNVVIRLWRTFFPKEQSANPGAMTAGPPAPLSPQTHRLMDTSGAYMIEAYVRVEDGSNSDLAQQATQELQAFANDMQGAVNFFMPDRLAFDTRVKS